MTEFKRTTQAVDDVEKLVQVVLDGGTPQDVQQLSRLVGETAPVVEKLGRKAAETDPAKQTYGPQMREKVQALVAKWGPIEGLARDILRQRGVEVVLAEASAAPPPPAPPAPLQFRTFTPGGAPPVSQVTSTRPAAPEGPSFSSAGRPGTPLGGSSAPSNPREAAARAAEARLRGGNPGAASSSAAAAAPSQPPGDAGPVPMEVDGAKASGKSSGALAARPPSAGPPVERMEDLLRLVHCVFLGHGFTRADGPGTQADVGGAGPFRLRYAHEVVSPGVVVASYVPLQRHLVIYATVEGTSAVAPVITRANVQLGMPAASVQAKVDYLVVYPLIYRQCLPTLASIPPEVCFGLLTCLALPALAALSAASRTFTRAILEDDVLWWRILLALPPSDQLTAAIGKAMDSQRSGDSLPAGTCRSLVRCEVLRQRDEAAERRRRRLEQEELERQMRERQMWELRQPARNPFAPPGPGFGVIGGDRDLFPGGGFMPPFGGGGGGFGGRRPFGGGGGFGGGLM